MENYGALISPFRSASAGAVYQNFSEIEHCSNILDKYLLADVISRITVDSLSKLSKPVLKFSTESDGVSLRQLVSKAPEGASIILFSDLSKNIIVGAFLSDTLSVSSDKSFFGRGITFIFHVVNGSIVSYHWSTANERNRLNCRFIRLANDSLEIGGGSGGHFGAIHIDGSMKVCQSGPSTTFDSPSLIADQNGGKDNFQIGSAELLGFEELRTN